MPRSPRRAVVTRRGSLRALLRLSLMMMLRSSRLRPSRRRPRSLLRLNRRWGGRQGSGQGEEDGVKDEGSDFRLGCCCREQRRERSRESGISSGRKLLLLALTGQVHPNQNKQSGRRRQSVRLSIESLFAFHQEEATQATQSDPQQIASEPRTDYSSYLQQLDRLVTASASSCQPHAHQQEDERRACRSRIRSADGQRSRRPRLL